MTERIGKKVLAVLAPIALVVWTLLMAAPQPANAASLLGIDGSGRLYDVNPGDASLTTLGDTGFASTAGLARDPLTGRLWASSGLTLFSFTPGDPTAASAEFTLATGYVDTTVRDLAFTASGALYVLGHSPGSSGGSRLYEIDRNAQTASNLLSLGGGIVGRADENLTATAGRHTVDLSGTPTLIDDGAITGAPGGITHMSPDPFGFGLYLLRACNSACFPNSDLYHVDLATRSATFVGTPGVFLTGIAVPEPSTGLLLASGLLGLAIGRCRRAR